MPTSRSKPSTRAAATTTPHARMIVRARRTSPPSRCTCRVVGVDPRDLARDEDLGTEPPRLLQRPAGKLVAGDARREAEVVLDPGRGARLAARGLALDHDRPQALRGAVDRGREAGRAGADDHRVVLGCGRLGAEAEQLRDAAKLRPHDGLAADDADRRQVVARRQRAAPLLGGVGLVGLEPGERDLVAVEEAPQVGARRVEPVPDDDRAWRRRLRGDALQAARARSSGGREPADLLARRRARGTRPRGSPAARSASRAMPRRRGSRLGRRCRG